VKRERPTAHFVIVLILAAALTGCSSSGVKPVPPDAKGGEPATSVPAPAPPDKRGGYYLDDGPGDHPPADIDAIPDAVPRQEPPLPRANRHYVALGESYTPMTEYQPYKASGIASWYGKRYHANKTSSGEIYDMYGMTAAHPTLPIPSYVRVTNPENGKSVVVRVNDRGPFKKDRLIDLSYAAAYKLRIVGKGSGLVEVEAIETRAPALPVAPNTESVEPDSPARTAGTFVQVGAFKMKENADQLRATLQGQSLAQNVVVENWYNDGIYRVRLGPYPSRDDAERAAGKIRQALGISTLVTTQ
jgi:rare lipoprotein A